MKKTKRVRKCIFYAESTIAIENVKELLESLGEDSLLSWVDEDYPSDEGITEGYIYYDKGVKGYMITKNKPN